DASKAADSRAADHAMQHGLGLIAWRVAGRDRPESLGSGDSKQRLVSGLACPFLQICPSRYPRIDRVKLATKPRGERRHESSVAIRIAPAQVVVDVRDPHASRPVSELDQGGKKRHGVRATRYGHQYRLIRPEHRMASDRARDLAENRLVHGSPGSASQLQARPALMYDILSDLDPLPNTGMGRDRRLRHSRQSGSFRRSWASFF